MLSQKLAQIVTGQTQAVNPETVLEQSEIVLRAAAHSYKQAERSLKTAYILNECCKAAIQGKRYHLVERFLTGAFKDHGVKLVSRNVWLPLSVYQLDPEHLTLDEKEIYNFLLAQGFTFSVKGNCDDKSQESWYDLKVMW